MENELQVIVKESGLEETKAQVILSKFQDYFAIASEWEAKAKNIVVTSANQKPEMEMARVGRLFLKEKRTAIEKARKELKEQALREGKAIDGIANVLKALIVPVEEYLEKQEKFVEIQEAAKAEALRIEVEKRIEEERIAKEKEVAAEQERIRVENERLKQEAVEREKKIAEERKAQEIALNAERAKADAERKELEAKAKAEREAAEAKAKAEQEKQAKILAEQKTKADAEKEEKERLEELLKSMVECPKCHHKFSIK